MRVTGKKLYVLMSVFFTCIALYFNVGQAQTFEAGSERIEASEEIHFSEKNGEKEFRYIEYEDHICIVSYVGAEHSVSIPEELAGKPVTELKGQGFLKYAENNVLSLEMPDTVTSLGVMTFAGCSTLETVRLSSGLKIIPDGAFLDCTWLQDIIIPEGVEEIRAYAFAGCEHLEDVVIPESITSIGRKGFSGCINLKTLNIPDSVKKIGSNAFEKTIWLDEKEEDFFVAGDGILIAYNGKDEHVVIPDYISVIGCDVFADMNQIKSVDMNENVTEISENAFSGCSSLEKITMPEHLKKIGNAAFSGTPWLENQKEEFVIAGDGVLLKCNSKSDCVTVPGGVRIICSRVFEENSNALFIELPDTVEEIRSYAFAGCVNLRKLVIPDSVEWIGDYLFDASCCIQDITLPARKEVTLYPRTLYTWSGNYRIHIPETVEKITFYYVEGEEITVDDTEYVENVGQVLEENIIICGETGSYAEEFAKTWGRAFEEEETAQDDREKVSGNEENEVTGFDTPEEMMRAFVAGLQNRDMEQMLSAFAIEEYVERYELKKEIEHTRIYMMKDGQIPNISGYAEQLNCASRRRELIAAFRRQYLSMMDAEFMKRDTYNLIGIKEYDDDPQRLLDDCFAADEEEKLNQIVLKGFFDLTDLEDEYCNTPMFYEQEEAYGGQIRSVSAWITISGEDYLMIMDAIRYGERWYGLKPTGMLGTVMGMKLKSGGLISFEELELCMEEVEAGPIQLEDRFYEGL